MCFQICAARNFHKAFLTIRPRNACCRRTIAFMKESGSGALINGNATVDRATFAHRARPGAWNGQ
ncbi:hypothetical protein EMIT0P260_70205 [Pseudomonas sp. IT-P260]